jgi:5-carboxymethyl-2-hydroxymuconate isomerase
MPHLTINYTPNLEGRTDLDRLCRALADAMLAVKDEEGKPVFPPGGVRVLAYPAAHYAVSDGKRDYAFCYLNLRMGRGRSAEAHKCAGEAITDVARAHFEPIFEDTYLGLTIQIDEGPEVFDGKHSTIHPLFKKS